MSQASGLHRELRVESPIAAWWARCWPLRPWVHWTIQVVLLLVITVWILVDPAFPEPLLRRDVWNSDNVRSTMLSVARLIAISNLAYLLAGLFFGSTPFRSLQSMTAVVTLVGLWIAMVAGQSELAWQGKRYHVFRQLPRFESLANTLRNQWPTKDGDLPELGPFMAYPFGKPSVLVLLTPPRLHETGMTIAAVERSPEASLLFQIVEPGAGGTNQQDWVEWHPAGQPRSFAGGLQDHHEFQRSAPLGDHWYLVRYSDA